MQTTLPDDAAAKRRFLLIGATIIAIMALMLLAGWWTVRRLPGQLTASLTRPTERIVTAGEIVTRVRALNRLETASVEVMHLSTASQSYKFVPNAVAGDELTFLAIGQVIAGVDLSRMNEGDIRFVGRQIYVTLPAAQILVSRLDNTRSHVVRRDTGMLRREDNDLESRVRARAEGEIRSEAVRKGILTLAQKNAEERIAELLHRSGYDKVTVTTQQSTSPLR